MTNNCITIPMKEYSKKS